MEKEVIKIEPSLKKIHFDAFLRFCNDLHTALNKKDSLGREEHLFQLREGIEKVFSGKNLHDNIDLYFIESLIIDLLLQDWELVLDESSVSLKLTSLNDGETNLEEKKEKTRRRHLLARNAQLQVESVLSFIKMMEKRKLTTKGWHSIFSVMRDGYELKQQLTDVINNTNEEERLNGLQACIKPYIQFVEQDKRCQHTGLLLSEIWRYFRHTWVNEYKSLPGRSISILIRDAAAPNHPVIGIAALGSSVAQQTCRDKWIGWEGDVFFEKIKSSPSSKYGKWIIATLNSLLKEVYIKDFLNESIITRADLKSPTLEKIANLKTLAIKYRKDHTSNPHGAKFSAGNRELSWSDRAQTKLFKSKRASVLAELLLIKAVLNKHGFTSGHKRELESCLSHADFKYAVERLVRKAKSMHVGINMMDIIVCGSIAPYNHLLGGKLVCMLLTSPEVTKYYNSKYLNAISLIASSMRGKSVIRKPQLVLLGTTSLYGVGSSQYNRIKIPTSEVGGDSNLKVEYKELGFSEGYGSFHFSSDTIWLADKIVGKIKGGKKVNSIFGEGANPLLRKLRDALDQLGLDSEPILNHRNKRVVYGICLAENFDEILVGLSKKAKYLIPQAKEKQKTELISKYWIKRWLQKRVFSQGILDSVGIHGVSYPVTHGARVPIKEEENLFTIH